MTSSITTSVFARMACSSRGAMYASALAHLFHVIAKLQLRFSLREIEQRRHRRRVRRKLLARGETKTE